MTRKNVTLTAKVAAFSAHALCPKCFKPFAGDVQFDHDIPLGLDGPDYDEKPMVPLHAACHLLKTKSDVARIAKAERQAGRKGQYARRKRNGSKLKSKGFDKSLSKSFDGKVRKKDGW